MMTMGSTIKELPKLTVAMDLPYKRAMVVQDWVNAVILHCKGCNLECGKYIESRFQNAEVSFRES